MRRSRSAIGTTASLLAGLAILMVTLFIALPMPHYSAGAGLDPSWATAISELEARGAVFGRDVIFTYGPYMELDYPLLHPASNARIVLTSLYLGSAVAAAIALLAIANRAVLGAVIALALLSVSALTRDGLFVALPGLLLLRATETGANRRWPRLTLAADAWLWSAVAVEPFVKGSFAVVVGVAGGCAFAAMLLADRRRALLCAAAGLVSLLGFWALAGQPLAALPTYLASLSEVIGGYAEAMNVPPNPDTVLVLVPLLALAGLAVLWGQSRALRHEPVRRRASLLLAFAACVGLQLFVSLKSALVRGDDGHTLVGMVCYLAVVGVYALRMPVGPALAATAPVALAAWLTFEMPWPFADGLLWTFERKLGEIETRLTDPAFTTDGEYLANLHYAGANSPFLPHPGRYDIYPFDQGVVLGMGVGWSPRPSLQSYVAYNPALLRANQAHLEGPDGPDRVLYTISSLDGRLPMLDDSLSLPTLLSAYAVTDRRGSYLELARTAEPPARPGPVLGEGTATMGQPVALPEGDDLVWARLDLAKTLRGTLRNTLRSATRLSLVYRFADGDTARFRLVPGIAEAGFVVSPMIRDVDEFMRARSVAGRRTLAKLRPVSFTVEAEGAAGARDWRADYRYELSRLAIDRGEDMTAFLEAGQAPRWRPADYDPPALPVRMQCVINDTTAAHAKDGGGGTTLSGWAIYSDRAVATAPFQMRLLIWSAAGYAQTVDVAPVPLPKMAASLGFPQTWTGGFDATFPTPPPGNYRTELLLFDAAGLARCSVPTALHVPG